MDSQADGFMESILKTQQARGFLDSWIPDACSVQRSFVRLNFSQSEAAGVTFSCEQADDLKFHGHMPGKWNGPGEYTARAS